MSSATVSSAATPSFYSMNGTLSMNGTEFASGLDTQSLIKALTANISSQIDKEKKMEQKAEWRRDAFRSVEDLLQKFSDTYFSYSTNSPLNIMSREFFDSEELVSSNSSIVSGTGAQSDAGNVVIDSIGQLATAATYTGSQVSHESINSTEALGSTISAGSYLNLNVNGKTYTLSLGANIDTAGLTTASVATKLATQLNTQAVALNKAIKNATDQDAMVGFSTDQNGKIILTGAAVTGGSYNLKNGLGTGNVSNGNTTFTLTDGTSIAAFTKLDDQLAGTTLTVQLDGLSKTITFDDSEKAQYNSADNVRTYLQGKMDTAFGMGSPGNPKVSVTMSNGKLSFTTPTDSSSVLQFTASSSGVLGYDGLLHIRSGESNRLELDKTLDELNTSSELNTGLTSGTIKDSKGNDIDGYKLVVNGKEFSFDKNTELNTVINTINDDATADVNISYSQTLNQFRIVSDDTGAQENINIYDEQGNLSAALFGGDTTLKSTDLSTAPTSDATSSYNITLGDNSPQPISVTRSANQSLSSFVSTVQTAIDDNSNLNGKVTAGLSADGKSLIFKTTDGSKLTIAAQDASNDILGFGTTGKTASAVKAGGDLTMSVELGGTKRDITRSTNSFTLDGVTLHVTGQTKTGDSPITFSASNNVDDLYKKISDFVDKYNEIVSKINTDVATMPATQSTNNGGGTVYDPLTDDQKKTMTDAEITEWNTKAQQGLLFCDPQMSAVQTDIRTAMEGNVSSVGMSLADIGISTAPLDTTSGGKLIIDTTKLKDMLKSDPDKVEQLFTNADGVASRVKDVIKKNIGEFSNSGALFDVAGSSTMIGADTSEIGSEITDYDKNIKDLQTQLQDQQDSLQSKFTNMEMIISQLSSQYNYMSSMSSS